MAAAAAYQGITPVARDNLIALGLLVLLGVLLAARIAQGFLTNPGRSASHRLAGRADQDDPARAAEILYAQDQQIQSLSQQIEQQAQRTAELQQSHDRLQQYSNHLHNVIEEERTHLSHEIHNELGQALTGIKMDLHQINRQLSPDQAAARERIVTSMKLIDQTIAGMRRISAELRPGVLDDLGLVAALEWLAAKVEERSGVEVSLILEPADIDVPMELNTGLFRIVQETIAHILEHAPVSQIWVTISQQPHAIQVTVRDNECEVNSQILVPTSYVGWTGIHVRALELGGKAEIQACPDSGLQVNVIVPAGGESTGQSVSE